MTNSLPYQNYAAQLREFIRRHSGPSSPSEPVIRQETEKQFGHLTRALFALQFSHNPAYRKFCQSRGVTPENLVEWTDIPAIPTAAFKELDLSCLATDQRSTVFHSSGTTDQKHSRHFHNAESLTVYEASLLPWFCGHVLPDFTLLRSKAGELQTRTVGAPCPKFLCLTPSPALAPHSSLVHMFETVRRELDLRDFIYAGIVDSNCAWSLDVQVALRALHKAVENDLPVVLLGTAFSIVHLLDHLADNKIRLRLPGGSRAMETGGYKGRSRSMPKTDLHALITTHLRIPQTNIICEYGMSELSSQAYDLEVRNAECGVRNEDRVFHLPPWARVQIISPENGREVNEGETGLIRIFDLANVSSVLAIQTEDLGIRRDDGFELIGRAALTEPRGCSLMAM